MELGSMVASGRLTARGGFRRPLCRNFARGSCRWGQRCRFSHDRSSAQICRYFQRGFCSYGEQCSYQHIQEELVPSRYGLDPSMPPWRWGPEPGTVPRAMSQGWVGAQHTSDYPAPSGTRVAFRFPNREVEVEEKDEKNVAAPGNVQLGATGGEFVPAGARCASGSQHADSSYPRERVVEMAMGTDPAEVSVGAAAIPVPSEALRARSEAVVCGICMDRVYEKPLPEERLFGILPNCSHAYCVGCIRKWRRSRDFQSTVRKACPECRVTSSYYIPHKYWISDGGEKEQLVRAFKAWTGKIRCKFFVRNRGHCPFRSDCIYLHELPPGRQARRRRRRRLRVPVEFSPSSSESSGEGDEELCTLDWDEDDEDLYMLDDWDFTLAKLQAAFRDTSFDDEMLFLDFGDSD